MSIIRDDDEERLARIEQMLEDLARKPAPAIPLSGRLRADAIEAMSGFAVARHRLPVAARNSATARRKRTRR